MQIRSLLKKVGRVVGATLLTLIILLGGTVLTVLQFPSVLINPRVLKTLAPLSASFGLALDWKNLEIQIESLGFFHKKVRLSADELCWAAKFPPQSGCLKKIDLNAEVAFEKRKFQLKGLGPIVIQGGGIRTELKESAQAPNDFSLQPPSLTIPDFLKQTRFYPLSIQPIQIKLLQGDKLVVAQAQMEGAPDAQGLLEKIELRLNGEGDPIEKGEVQLTLVSPSRFTASDWKVDLKANASLKEQGALQASVFLDQENLRSYRYQVRGSFSKDGRTELQLEGKGSVQLDENFIQSGQANLQVQNRSPQASESWASSLELGADREEPAGSPPSNSKNYSYRLNGVFEQANEKTTANLKGKVLWDNSSLQNIFVDLSANRQASQPSKSWQLATNGEARLASAANSQPSSEKDYRYQIQGRFQQKAGSAQTQIQGHFNGNQLQANVQMKLEKIDPKIRSITTNRCLLDLKRMEKQANRATLGMDCPLQVHLVPLKLPSATEKFQVTLPQTLSFLLKSELETFFYPNLSQPVSGRLELTLTPIVQELLKAQGNFQAKFSGVPAQYPKGWNITTSLNTSVLVPQFQKIVRALHATAWAIPAPLNALDGKVELGVSGEANLTRKSGKFPLFIRTALSSQNQDFNLEGRGESAYRYTERGGSTQLNLDLELSQLKLALPHLDLTSTFPQLAPDSRIRKLSPKKSSSLPSSFRYQVRVHTPRESPALLTSNLTKKPIPLHLDLNLEKEKMGGTVQIGQTDLKFFKRDAKMERLKVALKDPQEQSELNGLLTVSYTDYLIKILVLGTVGKPRIVLRSEPPLSEEELISVLIYGRPFGELDTSTASSVGSVSAALTDRALSLGSLYLLASTPIESVSYNPQTQNFFAKVRLAKGTSLNIGSEWGKNQQVGLRKKLGKNWIINTYIENDSEKKKQGGGVVIEWSKRY